VAGRRELVKRVRERREEKMGKKLERLVFALNGGRYEISPVDPSLTLLEFIRTQTCFKGTKLGCGEGNSICGCFGLIKI
jgi:xanthine dehydrogenase iron-sulfur cluster and FAD-binding subunit A